jgi:hypothetical protein
MRRARDARRPARGAQQKARPRQRPGFVLCALASPGAAPIASDALDIRVAKN